MIHFVGDSLIMWDTAGYKIEHGWNTDGLSHSGEHDMTTVENSIFLPKWNNFRGNACVCTTNATTFICVFIARNNLLQQRLFLETISYDSIYF